MLCRQCRRLATRAASATRQDPVVTRAIRPLDTSSICLSRRALSTSRSQGAARELQRKPYSTSSDAAAKATTSPTTPTSLEKPDYLDDGESAIWDQLTAEFSPTELMVQDISGGCGTMYGIEIASAKFQGTTMLKQQRMVNAVLGDRMKRWHGVQLRTKVP
ncbi:bola-like protein [Xylariaceae sp. FL0662B]|nr:bola-like protein [Xylariaceae sp. FL0662B]